LPFLPTEVKKEILKFCDQPTLAKTSTLSLAFLQLSSPLLYRHITFEGPEGLTKFLTLVVSRCLLFSSSRSLEMMEEEGKQSSTPLDPELTSLLSLLPLFP
ncbi:hypothetical protein BDY24DRAFT_381853, partial [Mrakia frigida]|uniref:uncharacterized protein n=1 Tax=Mrakia frigida TaxID=29902 RepID=UPI003FCC05E3